MVDINKILSSLSSSSTAKGALGGFAGGALASSLMSKKGRKNAKTLLKVGGVAAVGTMAWKAYKSYQQNNNPQSAQANQPQPVQNVQNTQPPNWNNLQENVFQLSEDTSNSQSLLILKSMVAAAMSDGHIDGKEFQNITKKADDLGVQGDDRNLVFNEIQNPMSLQQVVSSANCPELAVEVYTASLLAIDESTPQAQNYLGALAQGLNLPQGLVTAVHSQVQATLA